MLNTGNPCQIVRISAISWQDFLHLDEIAKISPWCLSQVQNFGKILLRSRRLPTSCQDLASEQFLAKSKTWAADEDNLFMTFALRWSWGQTKLNFLQFFTAKILGQTFAWGDHHKANICVSSNLISILKMISYRLSPLHSCPSWFLQVCLPTKWEIQF